MAAERRRLYLFGDQRCRQQLRGALEVRLGVADASLATTAVSLVCPEGVEGGRSGDGDWLTVVLDPGKEDSADLLLRLYRDVRALEPHWQRLFVLAGVSAKEDVSAAKAMESWRSALEEEQKRWDGALAAALASAPSESEEAALLGAWLAHRVQLVFVPAPAGNQKAGEWVGSLVGAWEAAEAAALKLSVQASAPLLSLPSEEAAELTPKPPTLHWSEEVLPEEAELRWRFRLPARPPPPKWAAELASAVLKEAPALPDYVYRWTHGLLLQYPLTKLCLSWDDEMVEAVCRCDLDELGASEEKAAAEELVWASLQPCLLAVFSAFASNPLLPFTTTLTASGETFVSRREGEEVGPWEVGLDVALRAASGAGPKRILAPGGSAEVDMAKLLPLSLDKEKGNLAGLREALRRSSGLAAKAKASRKSSQPSREWTMLRTPMAAPPLTSLSPEGGEDQPTSPGRRRMSACDPNARRRVSFGHVLVEDAKKLNLDGQGAPSAEEHEKLPPSPPPPANP